MATFVDGLIGYEYFIETGGTASIEQVNDFLKENNRNPIAERTFTHYHSLWRYGYRSYFPINQFDVSRTLGRMPVSPDRRRYDREEVNINAEISSDGEEWFAARIINKSLVGFGLETLQKLPMKNNDPVWVRLENYRNIPAIFIWKKKIDDNTMRFGVRAVEFISSYQIKKEVISIDKTTGILVIKKTSEENINWEELYDLMEKIEKLIDASSELLKYVAKLTNRDVKITQPVLSSINFSSPGEVSLILDWKIFALVIVLIKILQFWRLEKDRFKEETRAIKLNNDMREIQIEYARKTIKSKKVKELDIINQLLNALNSWVKEIFKIDKLPSNLFDSKSLEKAIATEQLFQAAEDLIGGDDSGIQFQAEESSSDQAEDES